jgi:hypothetical protein
MVRLRLVPCIWLLALAAAFEVRADKMVLKDGEVRYGRIIDERDSLVRYIDRHDRPKKLHAAKIDSIIYDLAEIQGRVKFAYRRGVPKDWTGYFSLRHTDYLDLDVIYETDTTTEMDLFFLNGVHVRILAQSRFQIQKTPKGDGDPVEIRMFWGGVLAEGHRSGALLKLESDFGVGALRGKARMAFQAGESDSAVVVACLNGLVGVQEKITDPGEFVVDSGAALSFARKEGVFKSEALPEVRAQALAWQANNMGHYLLARVEYPPIGYLPRAITGLGFLVFFYGSTLGVLDYVNNL